MGQKSIRPGPEGIIIGLVTLIAIGVNVFWTYQRAREALEGEIREGLLRTVSATARMLDGRLGDEHRAFHPEELAGECSYKAQWERLQSDKKFSEWRATTMETPVYGEWKKRMEEVRQATAHVRYMYTCVRIGEQVYFGFNETPQSDLVNNVTGAEEKDGKPDLAPNLLWPYPDAGDAQIKALKEGVAAVDSKPYTDIWGTYYSGYAPFYDSKGGMVGTIGMDLELTGFNERLAPVIVASKRAAVTGLCVAILSGVVVWFVRRLCSQLWGRAGTKMARTDGIDILGMQSEYAAGLLGTIEHSKDPREQLEKVRRVIDAGREREDESRSNFRTEAVVEMAREQAKVHEFELEVEVAPELPGGLYASAGRLSEALADCIEALAGPGLHLNLSMEEEKIHWLTLVAVFTRSGENGADGVMDILAENRMELASAQAHARAMRGELVATRSAGVLKVELKIPVQKTQTIEAGQ